MIATFHYYVPSYAIRCTATSHITVEDSGGSTIGCYDAKGIPVVRREEEEEGVGGGGGGREWEEEEAGVVVVGGGGGEMGGESVTAQKKMRLRG